MSKDKYGYFYFVDRIGDTFRWKGENVATSEVEQVISALPWVAEVTIYGVTIPGKDGRAGMAAIAVKEGYALNMDELIELVSKELPSYARPLFVRNMQRIETTTTFKHNKALLTRQGFNPDAVDGDPLYLITYTNNKNATKAGDYGSYVTLDKSRYAEIIEEKVQM